MTDQEAGSRVIHNYPRAPIATVLVSVAMLLAVVTVRDFRNPDWFAYKSIYEQQGAWLTVQNRDPLFVWFNNAYLSWAGPDSYEQFRDVLSMCYVLFTMLLMRGRIVPFVRQYRESLVVALAVLSLLLLKFTVQIREGLALILILIAIGRLMGVRSRTVGQTAPRGIGLWASLPWFIAAMLLHFVAAYHLLLVLIAAVRTRRMNASIGPVRRTIWSIRSSLVLLLALGLVTVISVGASLPDGPFATIYGDGLLDPTEGGVGKILYWCIYGALMLSVRGGVKELQVQSSTSPVFGEYVGLLAHGLAPAIYVASLTLLAVGTPAAVMSAVNRLLTGVLTLIFALLAMQARRRRVVVLGSAFLLADQARTVVAALLEG